MHERLRTLRKDKEFTQAQVASKLCISQKSLSSYEIGKTNIPICILRKLAFLYDTSIDYMLDMTDEKKPYPRSKNIRL